MFWVQIIVKYPLSYHGKGIYGDFWWEDSLKKGTIINQKI